MYNRAKGTKKMIEMIQIFTWTTAFWIAWNVVVLIFNACFLEDNDNELEQARLIATIFWVVIIVILLNYIQFFVRVVP